MAQRENLAPTGWNNGLCQDYCRSLSLWFASRIDARTVIRRFCPLEKKVSVNAQTKSPWVVVSPKGVEYVGLCSDESEAWCIALGWPSAQEIADRKAQGWYACESSLSWAPPHASTPETLVVAGWRIERRTDGAITLMNPSGGVYPLAGGALSQFLADLLRERSLRESGPSTSAQGVFCYSWDDERFIGGFASREAAIAEAKADRPDKSQAFVATIRHPHQFISPESLGSDICDRIHEYLQDETGEAADLFSPSEDQQRDLGALVLRWIQSGPGFGCWGVKDVTKIELQDYDAEGKPIQAGAA